MTAEASPSPTPSKEPEQATALTIACEDLVGGQTMYDFNPNFGLIGAFTPDAGTAAALAASDHGTLCRWVNETSGATIDVTASTPTDADLVARKASAASGEKVADVGADAWFAITSGVGTIQAFDGGYWVTVASTFITEGSEAHDIAATAIRAARIFGP